MKWWWVLFGWVAVSLAFTLGWAGHALFGKDDHG